jgi:preprotein translocase subunit SecA
MLCLNWTYHHWSVNKLFEEVNLDPVCQKDPSSQPGKHVRVMAMIMANHHTPVSQSRLLEELTETLKKNSTKEQVKSKKKKEKKKASKNKLDQTDLCGLNHS